MNEVSPHKAPTLVGIVYYADDPDKKVFRIIYPEFDDRELDQPPHDGNRQIMHDEHGKSHPSRAFADRLARLRDDGVRRLVIVIGN